MGFIWDEKKKDDKKFTDHISNVTKGLEDSKTGLQKDIKKFKKQLKDFDGIDPVEHTKIKTELQNLKDKTGKDETDAEKRIRVMRDQHETEMKDLKESVSKLKKAGKKSKKESQKNFLEKELAKALAKAGIKKTLISAAERILKPDVVVTIENGKMKAIAGDKSLKDHVKDWAKSEEGKHFIKAPSNKGGNANGGDDSKSENDYEKYFKSKTKNITKQILLKKSNPDLHDKLSKKYNK